MSQSGRLNYGTGPVPGAGIQTITGNNGLPNQIHGDGAANVNILGAGAITVTGDAANTLTISSTAIPALYTTDAGLAGPDGANNVNILGGVGITTTGDGASTINVVSTAQYTVDTPAVVDPANNGNLNIEGQYTTDANAVNWNNIITSAASIPHPVGPNTVGIELNPIVGVTALNASSILFSGGTLTALGATRLASTLRLNSFPSGALVTDAFGVVSAANGIATTVLTANPGGAPSFQPVPGYASSSFFARQIGDTGLITGDNTGNYVYLGANIALTTAGADCFNIGSNLTPGNGAGTPAEYIAPFAGTYMFNIQVAVYQANSPIVDCSLVIRNVTQGRYYYGANACQSGYLLSTSGNYVSQYTYSLYVQLSAADVITFGLNKTTPSVPSLVGITGSQIVHNNNDTYTATTFISGFKVA